MKKTVDLNGRIVYYELEHKKVKNVNLRIRADGSVYVSANSAVTTETVESFLCDKADYIVEALDKYAELAKYVPKEKEYISGESFRILGNDVRLKISLGLKRNIDYDGRYLYLAVKDSDDIIAKKKMIEKWIDSKCIEVFSEICDAIYPVFKKYEVLMPTLIVRDMTSRWGSCQPKRAIITLNKRLIEAPRNCVEYVIMHEFVHFIHANHSKDFYNFLSMQMPDWKERKRILESREYYRGAFLE